MASPIIRLENVQRTYHVGDIDVHALRDVSLTVNAGEFVAIMGSSGSGKSTLMAIIGCLDRPSSGRYFFEGVDVAGLAEPDRARLRSERLGFVFQSFNLLARTSALENVALPLFYAAAGPAGAGSRVERARAALKLLGLGERERNTPGQLSGGQQQRVAIARALINDPRLLLADEPTGNLDTRTSHEIMQTLIRLNRERGVTVILVTHELDIAAYADRVLTMRDGKIISDDSKPRKVEIADLPRLDPAAVDLLRRPPSAPTLPATGAQVVWGFGRMVVAAAVLAIARNMMRSALTMLGVFIGVAALIAMVAVGQGANEAVRKEIARLGTNLVVVLPGARTMGGVRAGSGSASTLTVSDAQAIRRENPAVGAVSYLIRQSGQVEFGNQNWTTSIQGISVNYPPMTNWKIAAGREISRDDEIAAALVVVIGQTVSRQLFNEFGESSRGAHPGQERSDARHRRSCVKGTDIIWTGPGRCRHDSVWHRGTQSTWRCRAKPAANRTELGLSGPSQSLWPAAAAGRICQSNLRPGSKPDTGSAGNPSSYRHARTTPSHQGGRR